MVPASDSDASSTLPCTGVPGQPTRWQTQNMLEGSHLALEHLRIPPARGLEDVPGEKDLWGTLLSSLPL